MSRSRRKTPIAGITTARSNKPFKIDEHRAERRNARATVHHTQDQDDPNLYRVYGDPWLSPKDGKRWFDPESKWMRK